METQEQRVDYEVPIASNSSPNIYHVDVNDEPPSAPQGTVVGVVRSIVREERNSFEGARINNDLADNDDGDEAYLDEEEDDDEDDGDVMPFVPVEGVNHFRRSAPSYFLDVDEATCDVRGGYASSNQSGDFFVGQVFEGKKHLKNDLDEWHIRNHRDLITVKSGPTVYTVKCKQHPRCPWRLHTSLSKKKGQFLIKKLVGPHNCVNANLCRDHSHLTSQLISRCILGLVKSQLGTTPSAIVEVVKQKFQYNISYGKAWRAKHKALKHLFGGWREAYSMLPKLIRAIAQTNSGTVYKVWSDPTHVQGTHILHGFFWAFGPAIEAFKTCRPLLSIDGTFLYGKYKGVLLIAMAVDANGQLLPVAYALVEGESIKTWTWFMNTIRELVTQREGIRVISDRQAGIMNVFNDTNTGWAPPKAYHRWCTRHFAQNFYTHVKDKKLMADLKSIASENQRCKFAKGRRKIEKNRPRAEQYLATNAPLPKWSLAHDIGGRRFGMMNTNVSEVYNNVLKGARGLPVAAIVELTFYRTNEYFRKRRIIANAQMAKGDMWAEEILLHLERKIPKSNQHYIKNFDDGSGLYEIVTPTRNVQGKCKGGRTHTVNLEEGKCTCGKAQLLHYPCSHLLAACGVRALDYNKFINYYYSVEALAQTWSHKFQPPPDIDYWEEWEGPTYIPDESLKHKKRGRRKSRRIRNDMDEMETGLKIRCSNCRQEGHNVRKCPARVGNTH